MLAVAAPDMSRESLRLHIPSSYDEEMDQLRAALEASVRTVTREETNRSAATPSASRRMTGDDARRSQERRREGRSTKDRNNIVSFTDDGDDRVTLVNRLVQRHGVSKAQASRAVDVMDGDSVRAEDVCLIVATVGTTVDRAVAYLRNVGWDVDLVISRMLDQTKSQSVESEREELKQRAASLRGSTAGVETASRTIKQDLNSREFDGRSVPMFSRSFPSPPGAKERDKEAERYHQEQWERERANRRAQASRANSNWESMQPKVKRHSQPIPEPIPEKKRVSEETPSLPRRSTVRSNPPPLTSEQSIGALQDKDLVQILTLLGVPPSSSSASAVRSAYRKAALRYHPDRHVSASSGERSYKSDVWKLLTSKMESFH